MRKVYLVMVVLSLLSLVGIAAADKTKIQPGMWSITIQVEMEGAPVAIPPRTIEKCVKPEEARDPIELLKSDRQKACQAKDTKMAGNKLTWNMECHGPEQASGSGEMTFSPGSYQGSMKMQMTDKNGVVHKMSSTYSGKRTGDCTP